MGPVYMKGGTVMGKSNQAKQEKPLDKMTATELREVARDIPEIQGAHAMNKEELLSAIKKARGIEEPHKTGASMRDVKAQIKEMKRKALEAKKANDLKRYGIYKKKAARLKKITRRAAR